MGNFHKLYTSYKLKCNVCIFVHICIRQTNIFSVTDQYKDLSLFSSTTTFKSDYFPGACQHCSGNIYIIYIRKKQTFKNIVTTQYYLQRHIRECCLVVSPFTFATLGAIWCKQSYFKQCHILESLFNICIMFWYNDKHIIQLVQNGYF